MTNEIEAEFIQSLAVAQLKAFESNIKWLKMDLSENTDDETEIYIQEQQLLAVAEPQPLYGIELKMQQTGLTKAQIQRIETDKTKATLAELILYCDGLNISLQDFVIKH